MANEPIKLSVGSGINNPSYGLKDYNKVYQEVIGRDIDQAGYKYWQPQIRSNKVTMGDLRNTLLGDNEYKDRHSAVAANPNVTEAELDALPSAYKGVFATRDDTLPHDLSIPSIVDGPQQEVEEDATGNTEVIYKNSPYGGPSLQDFEDMLKKMFSNPWTPYGYGWGGSNTKGAKMNRSLASRGSSAYKGMSSSFGRSGDRLSNLTGPAINL
jgi:hypothetical protein